MFKLKCALFFYFVDQQIFHAEKGMREDKSSRAGKGTHACSEQAHADRHTPLCVHRAGTRRQAHATL